MTIHVYQQKHIFYLYTIYNFINILIQEQLPTTIMASLTIIPALQNYVL